MGLVPEPLIEGLSSALDKVFTRAVPEAADRGTAEAPTILTKALANAPKPGELPPGIRERAPDVPFAGPEQMRQASRVTAAPATKQTLSDIVDNTYTGLSGLFKSEPGLPNDLNESFGETRSLERRIRDQVELELRDETLAPIANQGKQSYVQAQQLWDYMVNADRTAQAAAQGLDTVDGIPARTVEKATADTWNALTPAAQAAHENVRKKYDEAFQFAIQRGWIDPARYREGYSPIKRMAMVLDAMRQAGGEDGIGSDALVQFLRRAKSGGLRETDGTVLLTDYLTSIRRRAAQEDLAAKIINDPTLNFTDHPDVKNLMAAGKPLPKGLAYWTPEPGGMGYIQKDPLQHSLDGALDGMNMPQNRDRGRQFVLPTRVAEALNNYNPRIPGEAENAIYRNSRAFSRVFTSYNPAVTSVNLVSDHALALTSLAAEGGPGRVMGFLREWPDAAKSAIGGVFFGKGGAKYKRALNEGLASSTFTYDVGGAPVSNITQQFRAADSRTGLKAAAQAAAAALPDFLAKARQTGEMIPRIAAGQEALQRTGNLSEYGRVGREITVNFSKGPAIMRNPTAGFAAPFYTFFGAVTPKILSLATDKSTRGGMLTALAAVPTTVMLWNYHDDDYEKVENSLPDYERDNMHYIVPGPDGKPLMDPTGKPIVKRLQFWVPEQVASMFGLQNLPSRMRRVAEGRSTVGDFAGESASTAGRFWAGSILPARLALELGFGRSLLTGQEQKPADAIVNMIPQAKLIRDAVLNAKSFGPREAARRTLSSLAGLPDAAVVRKGGGTLDADLMDAKRDLGLATARMRNFYINGDTARGKDAEKDMKEATDRLQRIGLAMQATGKKPDIPPELLGQPPEGAPTP
jgi:hypothetical protein